LLGCGLISGLSWEREPLRMNLGQWAGVVGLLVGAAGSAQAAEPGVSIERRTEYFDVGIAKLSDIDAFFRERRTRGVHWFAQTRPQARWSVLYDGRGVCHLETARVAMTITLVLPRLPQGVKLSPTETRNWRELTASVRAHEDEHARIAENGAYEALAAIRGSTCAGWRADATAVWDRTNRRQDDFDRSDYDHGQATYRRTLYGEEQRPDRSGSATPPSDHVNGVPVEWSVSK